MAERKARAKRSTAPAKTRAPRARKTEQTEQAVQPEPGQQSYRPEPLPQRTGTHTRDYDPE